MDVVTSASHNVYAIVIKYGETLFKGVTLQRKRNVPVAVAAAGDRPLWSGVVFVPLAGSGPRFNITVHVESGLEILLRNGGVLGVVYWPAGRGVR